MMIHCYICFVNVLLFSFLYILKIFYLFTFFFDIFHVNQTCISLTKPN